MEKHQDKWKTQYIQEVKDGKRWDKYLEDENLFNIIVDEIGKKIVDEKETIKTILLIALGGRLVENCTPTSTNLMVNDEAGAGKDFVVDNVLDIIPREWIIKRKRISQMAFTYWKANDKNWSWDGFITYFEDIGNPILNCDVFKVMSSSNGNNLTTIVKDQMSRDIFVKGKPVMIITTYSAKPSVEILRRFPICQLDTTEKQTIAIMKRQAEIASTGIAVEYSIMLKKALNKLLRVKVKVPYADKLTEILSSKNHIIRTHFPRLLDYNKFSAAIHQKTRQRDKDGYILAEPQDYDIARDVLVKTTSNIYSIPLTKNQRKILEAIENHQFNSCSVTDLEPSISFISKKMLYTELDKLTTFGFLEKERADRAESDKPVMVWSIKEVFDINIPKWKDIEKTSNGKNASNSKNASNASNGSLSSINEKKDKIAFEPIEPIETEIRDNIEEIDLSKDET